MHPSVVVAGRRRRRRLLVLDDEPGRERPSRAGAAAAAARHPPRPRAGPAAGVAVGPAVAEALNAAGAAARGAARARVPPGGRREPVPQGPVGHGHARQHAQPCRRDHQRRHHRRVADRPEREQSKRWPGDANLPSRKLYSIRALVLYLLFCSGVR